MSAFKPHDTVRTLVEVHVPGWKTACGPGFHFTVERVNDDGTLLVSRSGPDGRVILQASDVEPAYRVHNGISYSSRTSEPVVHVLERARRTGQRIRVRFGDMATGRDWLEEHDVEGTIRNSTGPAKVPLLIHSRRSRGGPALLDDAIVKVSTTGRAGRTLYQHPQYHVGKMNIVPGADGFAAAVTVDGEPHARFTTHDKAMKWVSRMRGE